MRVWFCVCVCVFVCDSVANILFFFGSILVFGFYIVLAFSTCFGYIIFSAFLAPSFFFVQFRQSAFCRNYVSSSAKHNMQHLFNIARCPNVSPCCWLFFVFVFLSSFFVLYFTFSNVLSYSLSQSDIYPAAYCASNTIRRYHSPIIIYPYFFFSVEFHPSADALRSKTTEQQQKKAKIVVSVLYVFSKTTLYSYFGSFSALKKTKNHTEGEHVCVLVWIYSCECWRLHIFVDFSSLYLLK